MGLRNCELSVSCLQIVGQLLFRSVRYMDDPVTAIKNVVGGAQSYDTDTFPLVVDTSQGEIAVVFVNADSGEGFVHRNPAI